MSHPNYNMPQSLPVGQPIRRGDTVTHVDPLGNIVPEPGERPITSGGYLLPPGLAAQAAKEAEEPKPAASDVIAQDAAPPDYPPGCPEFRPLHRLSFLDKAAAFELFDAVTEAAEKQGMSKKGDAVSGKQAAAMYRVLAKIDDFFMFVALDKQAYADWEGRHDDTMFGKAWLAYQARAQPGEAVSSSS